MIIAVPCTRRPVRIHGPPGIIDTQVTATMFLYTLYNPVSERQMTHFLLFFQKKRSRQSFQSLFEFLVQWYD